MIIVGRSLFVSSPLSQASLPRVPKVERGPWPSSYVLRDVDHHVAAASKRVSRFPALHLSPQYHQGIRCCCLVRTLHGLICSPQGPCTIFSRQERNPLLQVQTHLSRVKNSRPRSSTQQMVSAQTARLGHVPTLFVPRPNPKFLITWSIQVNFHAPAPLDQSHKLPRDSHTRDQLWPAGANGIGLIVSGVLSGRGGQIIVLDPKSKDDELRVRHQVRLGVPVEQGVGTAVGGDEAYFSTPCKFGSAF